VAKINGREKRVGELRRVGIPEAITDVIISQEEALNRVLTDCEVEEVMKPAGYAWNDSVSGGETWIKKFPVKEAPLGGYTPDSGATSSTIPNVRFDLVSPAFIQCLAARCGVGASAHGDYNYRKGAENGTYLATRYNHFHLHFQQMFQELALCAVRQEAGESCLEEFNENLAACVWFLHMLHEFANRHNNEKSLAMLVNFASELTWSGK
jgi:hypothetical protein